MKKGFIISTILFIFLFQGWGIQAHAKGKPKKKVLCLTATAGFRHADSINASIEVLKKLAEESGKFEVVFTEDCAQINPENLKQYDAVIFDNTSGELPISNEGKKALIDFVKSGKGFMGIHAATDTCYSWPEYGELIGGRFDGHPWSQRVRILVEDKNHPSTKHLGDSFEIADEIYQHRDWSRDKVRVLLRLDPTSVDLNKPDVHRKDKDFGISWCRMYGNGRSFYTALGHGGGIWKDERYQKHILGAILWILGLEKGDAKPRPLPKEQR
jgi:type 1 glutamine amidotransferase